MSQRFAERPLQGKYGGLVLEKCLNFAYFGVLAAVFVAVDVVVIARHRYYRDWTSTYGAVSMRCSLRLDAYRAFLEAARA